MLLSAKLAPTFDYPVMEQFWRTADELGFHSVATYDHFYGLIDNAAPRWKRGRRLPRWPRWCGGRG